MKNYIKISFIVFYLTLFITIAIDILFVEKPVLEMLDLSIMGIVLLNTLVAAVLLAIREFKSF